MMSTKLKNEFLLIYALVILLIIIIIFSQSTILRVVFGLPFVLFIPGYTLLAAILPRKSSLDTIERLALSAGLSLVVTAIIGIILSYTPIGMGVFSVAVSFVIFIAITSAIAWYRRYRMGEKDYAISINFGLMFWKSKSRIDRILFIILIVSILGAAGGAGYAIVSFRAEEKYTEFYILNSEGKIENYPEKTTLGEEIAVIVVIINHEREAAEYRLEVMIEGEKYKEIGPIILADSDRWEEPVGFTPVEAGDNQKLEFVLFKDGGDEISQEPLHLWINVLE